MLDRGILDQISDVERSERGRIGRQLAFELERSLELPDGLINLVMPSLRSGKEKTEGFPCAVDLYLGDVNGDDPNMRRLELLLANPDHLPFAEARLGDQETGFDIPDLAVFLKSIALLDASVKEKAPDHDPWIMLRYGVAGEERILQLYSRPSIGMSKKTSTIEYYQDVPLNGILVGNLSPVEIQPKRLRVLDESNNPLRPVALPDFAAIFELSEDRVIMFDVDVNYGSAVLCNPKIYKSQSEANSSVVDVNGAEADIVIVDDISFGLVWQHRQQGGGCTTPVYEYWA